MLILGWEVLRAEGIASAKVLRCEVTWPTWNNHKEASGLERVNKEKG